jgi:hypothetical protein
MIMRIVHLTQATTVLKTLWRLLKIASRLTVNSGGSTLLAIRTFHCIGHYYNTTGNSKVVSIYRQVLQALSLIVHIADIIIT